jgi:hypothetical protein
MERARREFGVLRVFFVAVIHMFGVACVGRGDPFSPLS